MNIFPCKLVCKYKNPPYREIVLSPYIADFDSAINLTKKFISENSAYSLHRCSILLISGDNRSAAEFKENENVCKFEEIHNGFESSTCS